MPNTVSAKMSSADRVYVEVAGESTRMSLKDTSPSTHVHEPFCDRSSVVPGPCASRKHCPYTLLQPDSILQIQGCSSRARRPQAQGEVSSKRVKERKQWLQAATGRGQRARKRTNWATLKFFFFCFFFFCVTFCKCKLGRVQVPVPTADHGGGSRFTHGQGGGWAEEASVCKNLVSWRRASSTKLRLGGSSKKVAASARRR